MAQPTNFALSGAIGADLNQTYVVSASLTPETPAPPFALNTEVVGTGGAQYVFVQASTSISANDFVAITGAGQANSLTSVNFNTTGGVRLGVAPGAPVVTSTGMAAGTFFWAAINGSGLKGNTTAAGTPSDIQLWTSLTAGTVTSITSTSSVALGGVVVTASVTANPATFTLSWPRAILVYSSAVGMSGIAIGNP